MFASTLFVLAATTQATLPLPPYHRDATVLLGRYTLSDLLVHENIVYVRQGYDLEAYALPGLKRKWRVQLGKEVSPDSFEVAGKVILAESSEFGDKMGAIYAFDPANGKVLWTLPRQGRRGVMKVSGETLYASMNPLKFSAIDLKTRKAKWTIPLKLEKEAYDSDVNAISVYKNFVLLNVGNTTYCLDAKSGATRWSVPKSYMFDTNLVQIGGIAFVPSGEGSVGRNIESGKDVWTSANIGAGEYVGVFGNRFVSLDGGRLWAIDPKTGKEVWSAKTGPEQVSGGNQFAFQVGSRIMVRGIDRSGIYDVNGKELWSGADEDMVYGPIWTDGTRLICYSDGLRRYSPGPMAPIPADEAGKRKMAESMVAKYAELDAFEVKRLETLGDAAFDAVLDAFMKSSAASDKDYNSDAGSHYDDLGQLLTKIAKPAHADKLLTAFKTTKADMNSRSFLLRMLAKVGDPEVIVPYFLGVLRNQPTPGFEMYESDTFVARSYITASKHPLATEYMVGIVGDKKADEVVRMQAYWHAAGTGGEAGLAAVLKERRTREVLPPVAERLELGDMGKSPRDRKMSTLLEEAKDATGKSWGLVQSGVLASRGDLWIVEKSGDKWINPIFLGVTLDGVSNWAKPKPAERTVAGQTAAQVKAGGWKKLIPPDSSLTKDDDKDGLTNIMERRLGTDPAKADMDGDGDLDGVDPMPNAADAPKTDAEQILAAVMEARYHFNERNWPAVLSAEADGKPFEMVGWRGPVIWAIGGRSWEGELEQCYEQGVGFISFHEVSKDKSLPWADRCIKWDGTKTYARVEIATYYGGLNGTTYGGVVKKFGDKWVVIAMSMTSVS